VTKPTIPCQRPNGVAPLAWPGFTMLELEYELLEEAKKQGIKKVYRTTSVVLLHWFYCELNAILIFSYSVSVAFSFVPC